MSGNSATTIGNSRTDESVVASAASISVAPAPSVVTRITCAGAAQIRTVDAMTQPTEKPKSCASAPMPIKEPITTRLKTDVSAALTPERKSRTADGDGGRGAAGGADMGS